jgi:hypothetical protein
MNIKYAAARWLRRIIANSFSLHTCLYLQYYDRYYDKDAALNFDICFSVETVQDRWKH